MWRGMRDVIFIRNYSTFKSGVVDKWHNTYLADMKFWV